MNPRLTPELVLSAYCQGCFPMADPETGEISFYEPDPRALIPLDERFHIPHGLKRVLNKNLLNSGWIPLSGCGPCLCPDGRTGGTMDRRAD